jgi:protocatechuate 3,4-dioxygenase, beta subunit
MTTRPATGLERVGDTDAGPDPPYLFPDYRSTTLRAPGKPLLLLPQTLSELTGPVYGHDDVGALDHDLTEGHGGEPLGERIIVAGRVTDGDGRPVPSALI